MRSPVAPVLAILSASTICISNFVRLEAFQLLPLTLPSGRHHQLFIDRSLATPPSWLSFSSDRPLVSPINRISIATQVQGRSKKSDDYFEDSHEEDERLNILSGDQHFASSAEEDDENDIAPTEEMKPIPMSKNAGNRFVAIVWDQDLDTKGRTSMEQHWVRDWFVEDHVLFCRKRNLYNETFNTDSMVDIQRSLFVLSSDIRRVVGNVLLLESTDIKHVHELLEQEPIIKELNGGDYRKVQLYRWRHIRDHTLRIDDGRDGYPCMMVGMDDSPDIVGNLRNEKKSENMKYLIRSERVIAAGPLHLPTERKDDPESRAVGDFILFNAKDREAAIEFAEEMPYSMKGLYKDVRVHFYNNLDVTGKFVLEDTIMSEDDQEALRMKKVMESQGYPVDDEQTPWLNW